MKRLKAITSAFLVSATLGATMALSWASVWMPAGDTAGTAGQWPSVAEIDARQYCVFDMSSRQFLLEYKIDDPAYPASTTKIMTAILALESDMLERSVTVSASATDIIAGSSKVGLIAGEEIQFKDVLAGLMIASGNDAANVIAESLAGSSSGFAGLMNAKAAELGLTGTNFVNAHGLHDAAHVTTARDMAHLAAYAMQNDQFRQLAALSRYNMPATNKHPYSGWGMFNSTNSFLQFGDTVLQSDLISHYTGIKTGTTTPAGVCLVSSALTRDGHELIAVVFGVPSKSPVSIYAYSRTLFETAARMIAANQTTPTAAPQPSGTEPLQTIESNETMPSQTQPSAEPTPSEPQTGIYHWRNPWYWLLLALLALLIVLAVANLRSMRRRSGRQRQR